MKRNPIPALAGLLKAHAVSVGGGMLKNPRTKSVFSKPSYLFAIIRDGYVEWRTDNGLSGSNPATNTAQVNAILRDIRKRYDLSLNQVEIRDERTQRNPHRDKAKKSKFRAPLQYNPFHLALQFNAHGVWATIKQYPTTEAGMEQAKADGMKYHKTIPHKLRIVRIKV